MRTFSHNSFTCVLVILHFIRFKSTRFLYCSNHQISPTSAGISLTKMKKSLINSKHAREENYDNGHQYDPRVEFSKFIKEARQHTYAEEAKGTGAEKKAKKSWRGYLSSWWKAEKMRNCWVAAHNCNLHKLKRSPVSGPLYQCGMKVDDRRRQRSTSGPIDNLPNTDGERPYVCLDQLGSRRSRQVYGPVYFVT